MAATTIGILFATGINVYVAEKQWEAMDRAVMVSDKTMEQSTRAWVTLKDGQLQAPIQPGAFPSDTYHLINTGHSPALKVQTGHELYFLARLPKTIGEVQIHKAQGIGVLGQDNFKTTKYIRDSRAISQEEFQALRDKKLFAYSIGVVTYEDIFGKSHKTSFCHVVLDINTIEFSPCENDWNQAD